MFCGFGKEAFPAILDFAEKCKNLITAGLVHNYYLSLISIAGIGAFSMIFMAGINSIIQLNSADEYRGRAMSMYSLVLIGTTRIGNFFTGVITD